MTIEVSTLPNGLSVVTHEMPHLETVSLGVWIGAGARNETAAQNGISHVLEHMAFKGTKRRSARDIVEAIENVGGDINAATALETTAYHAHILKDDTALAIDVLSDILLNPTFDADELYREKDVILQEIAASLDAPEELVFDTAQSVAFPDQPTGRSILGTPATLATFDPGALSAYARDHYIPSRMIVSAAGAVTHQDILHLAAARFGTMEAGERIDVEPATFCGGAQHVQRSIEQTHVVMLLQAPAYGDPRYYAAQVFAGLFGGGMSSRLFQQVREQRGLCYNVYAYCWGMHDTGVFGVYAGTSGELADELRRVVRNELEDVAAHGPTQAELDRAKAQLKSGLLMSLESSSARAEQMARHLLAYGRTLEASELIERVNAVTDDDIREFAGGLAEHGAVVWSKVGPDSGAGAHLEAEPAIGNGRTAGKH